MTNHADGKRADITEKINKAAFAVYDRLGWRFAEKVCENATVIEG
jgi:hypothetical protein